MAQLMPCLLEVLECIHVAFIAYAFIIARLQYLAKLSTCYPYTPWLGVPLGVLTMDVKVELVA